MQMESEHRDFLFALFLAAGIAYGIRNALTVFFDLWLFYGVGTVAFAVLVACTFAVHGLIAAFIARSADLSRRCSQTLLVLFAVLCCVEFARLVVLM
jgi:hypothetical protein